MTKNENSAIENFEETKFFFDKCCKSNINILALGSHYKHFNINLEDFPSVNKKKNLWHMFFRSSKKNLPRFANFLDPNLGVGGPLFWTPCLEFKEISIFALKKNMSYFEDLWGQILMFEGQIRCIGPHVSLKSILQLRSLFISKGNNDMKQVKNG